LMTMPKKGKEPAGLRRWRLAHKNRNAGRKVKKIKRTKRKVTTMARRRYSRKRGGSKRRMGMPSIATGCLLLYAAKQFGWVDAATVATDGGDNAGGRAFTILKDNATITNALPVIVGGVVLSVARQAVGPVNLMRLGRFNIRAL
jgi:hypothetical protein